MGANKAAVTEKRENRIYNSIWLKRLRIEYNTGTSRFRDDFRPSTGQIHNLTKEEISLYGVQL